MINFNIESVQHCTSNEDGNEEITIEVHLSFWESLRALITRFDTSQTKTNTYILKKPYWVDKVTGHIPSLREQLEIEHGLAWLLRVQNRLMDADLRNW